MEDYKSLGGETFKKPELIEDELVHPLYVYTRTDKDGNPDPEGKYMLFGSYPQSRIDDGATVKALNKLAGAKPENGSDGAWTSYKYYIVNENDDSARNAADYMWYQDIAYGAERYRGVYFNSYRPNWPSDYSSSANSYQSNNDYYTDTVYWFKYEPLRWEILAERGSKAWLVSDMCIDSQPYRNVKYNNNYANSSIRKWLNGELLNTAFDEWERAQISLETVNNSRSSTGVRDNQYACADTLDYIHLLSVKETEGMDTDAKQRVSTEYARCQGAFVNPDNGNSWWWLRSPSSDSGSGARGINFDGALICSTYIFNAHGSVRPALWIEL